MDQNLSNGLGDTLPKGTDVNSFRVLPLVCMFDYFLEATFGNSKAIAF